MTGTESVAEHSHRAMVVAFFLAYKAGADPAKTMTMAAFHDLAETRTGDSDWLQKQYLTQDEDKALACQLDDLGKGGEALAALLSEYKLRESLESRVAKDADKLEYVLSLRELALAGNGEAKYRLESENASPDHLYTPEAKKLWKEIMTTHPTDWIRQDLASTYRHYKDMTRTRKRTIDKT